MSKQESESKEPSFDKMFVHPVPRQGPARIIATEVEKNWTDETWVHQWDQEFQLVHDGGGKVTISAMDAKWIINRLQLKEEPSLVFGKSTVWRSRPVEPEQTKKPKKEKTRRYYVISYLWKSKDGRSNNFGTGLVESTNGIVGVYEDCQQQEEAWCLTHVAEITKEEYDKANRDGIIG